MFVFSVACAEFLNLTTIFPWQTYPLNNPPPLTTLLFVAQIIYILIDAKKICVENLIVD